MWITMKISNIEIKNFKSFKNMSVSLNDFNVVVGQSASGKSNFVSLLYFSEDKIHSVYVGVVKKQQLLVVELCSLH